MTEPSSLIIFTSSMPGILFTEKEINKFKISLESEIGPKIQTFL